MNKNILFLVEGSQMEADNIRNIAKKLLKLTETDYQVCSYGTTIYELYEELEKDDMLGIK